MAGTSDRAAVLLAAALLLWPGAPASARHQVIDTDTAWGGEVMVRQTTVVRKGATLTIEPGTRVRFLGEDEDGDGIGDVALRVEGRIVARGTAGEPINFESARPEPMPRDWTFVILEFSRDSVFEFCRFRHAYSGLQVHYSTAVVRDCVFSDNVDGFRFSTANVLAERNLMEGNVNGIRYEERKSRATLRGNEIRGNEIGVFVVTEAEGLSTFRDNNIHDNRRYNVKMGMAQARDVPMPGNWWGTTDAGEIEAAIFDGADDETLGRLLWEPSLGVAAPGAGPHNWTGETDR